MPFKFTELGLPGVMLVEIVAFGDDRGFFAETYKMSDFVKAGIDRPFVQDNYSRSVKGVLRGLHYQLDPQAQGKLVRAVEGEIFDVAVDIRKDSPTFRKWIGVVLSGPMKNMLWIPEGFAHGFVVLSDQADVMYKTTAEYAPSLDRGIIWNDAEIGVEWPVTHPVLSPKDAQLPPLSEADIF